MPPAQTPQSWSVPTPPPPVEVEKIFGEPAAPPMRPQLVEQEARAAPEIARQRDEPAAPASEISLMLTPVPSFPRLVEIERRIQSLPIVRTLYVRDFRAGVATLAVGLRSPMSSDEVASALATLADLRMRVTRAARNALELRIEGEAGVA